MSCEIKLTGILFLSRKEHLNWTSSCRAAVMCYSRENGSHMEAVVQIPSLVHPSTPLTQVPKIQGNQEGDHNETRRCGRHSYLSHTLLCISTCSMIMKNYCFKKKRKENLSTLHVVRLRPNL